MHYGLFIGAWTFVLFVMALNHLDLQSQVRRDRMRSELTSLRSEMKWRLDSMDRDMRALRERQARR
jgi:hypothetical protein